LETSVQATSTPSYTLWQLILYMLRLGTLGFGGPVALVGYMHRDLVEDRQWMPQSAGLYALSLGLSKNFSDDHEMLKHGIGDI
jgi:chromate transport protein ChrA